MALNGEKNLLAEIKAPVLSTSAMIDIGQLSLSPSPARVERTSFSNTR